MADITIAPVLDASIADSTAHIIYTDAATGTFKKAPISALPLSDAEVTALALKAPLASPTFTGNPTAPTQTAGNNSTRIATTEFVTAAILAAPGGGGSLTVQDEGVSLATAATTINFVGAGVTASGTGATKTVTIAGGGGGGGGQALIMQHFVDDLGGVGDDATDNTAAFTAAMALDATQYYLFIPGGVFQTHTVDINPQLNIVGVGFDMWNDTASYPRGSVIKSIAAEPLFRYIENDEITLLSGRIQGIQFDGDDIGTIGLDVEGGFNFYYNRLGFRNFTSAGIKMLGCLIGTLDEMLFLHNENDVEMGEKTYTVSGTMPPNFIKITNCKAQYTKKWCFLKHGGSTLYISGGDFEQCGTLGQDSGVVKINAATEGIGLVFRENYCEQTKGFATISIQDAGSDVARYVIESCQFNSAGTALHDIYVDAGAAYKQRVYISNSLVRNAGGLTVDGANAFIHIVNSEIPTRTITAGAQVLEVNDDGEILLNGGAIGGILPEYTDAQFLDLALGSSDRRVYWNSTAGELQCWNGTDMLTIDTTPYSATSPLILDDFNRANNASSLGNSIIPASAWPTPSGTWGISSNQAYCPSLTGTGSATYYIAQQDAGVADFTLTSNITFATGSTAGGLTFRWVDDNNRLSIDGYIVGGQSGFDMFKTVAGVPTVIGTYGPFSPGPLSAGVPFELRVVCSGNTINVYLNSSLIMGPITESAFNTATHCGMLATDASTVGGSVLFDDFEVTG